MTWLRHLRWKLFISHLLIILIGVVVLLPTAHFLADIQLPRQPTLSLGSTAAEIGQVGAPNVPADAAAAPESISQQDRFQTVVDQGC